MDAAIGFVVARGDVVDRARLSYLRTGALPNPSILETAEGGLQVTVSELPVRAQIDVPVREQLIVELYSK